MHRRNPTLLFTALFTLALAFAPSVGAQEAALESDQPPLLRVLSYVPDDPEVLAYFSYIDYHAMFAARPGAVHPANFTEFLALADADTPESALMLAVMRGISSGPGDLMAYLLSSGPDMPQIVGFDFFDIERAVEYSTPPENVVLLEGAFIPLQIEAAHSARGYSSSAESTAEARILCPQAGCDSGANVDFANRALGNPFGGHLGRSQPVLIGDRIVASSTSYPNVLAVAGAISRTQRSLADNPDVLAGAEAVAEAGDLILQAVFIRPDQIAQNIFDLFSLNPQLSAEGRQTLEARLNELLTLPLPAYDLLIIADRASATEQTTSVALVYDSIEDAEQAADSLVQRLQTYHSIAADRPFVTYLEQLGVSAIEGSVITASTGRSVALLTLRAPLPDVESPFSSDPAESSPVYRRLFAAFMQRDLGWLIPNGG